MNNDIYYDSDNNDSNNNNHHNKTNHTKNNYTKYVTQAIKGANHHISYYMVDWYIISSFKISYIYIIIKILAYAFTFILMRIELQGSC